VLQKPWKIIQYLFPENGGNSSDKEDIDESNTGNNTTPSVDKYDKISSNDQDDFRSKLKREQLDIDSVIADATLEEILSTSKSVPTILSQYFLPMLYGLLGSLTYILRTLSTEIEGVTFKRASASRYSLRWPLGMLAGVTVGLFFDPARFAGLAAITALGIAFLAGYGVELFFTGLDGLVRTFTRDGHERPKAEAT